MKFVASRLSQGNKIFPAQVHIEEAGVEVKIPGFFSGDTRFISYEHISSVEIDSPMIGFSTITFYHAGNKVHAHGFTKTDAKTIKAAIDKGKKKSKTKTVVHVNGDDSGMPFSASNSGNSQTTIVNKAPSFLSNAAKAVGGMVANSFSEAKKLYEDEKEEEIQKNGKIENIASLTLSSDKEELQNQLNYLVSTGNSGPDKKLKQVIIEKIEFGVMKLNRVNASEEAAFFESKLALLKKRSPFDFLK